MRVDLHTHTDCSDGKLTPDELISRALDRKVSLLSITDHDTLSAYSALESVPAEITLVPGIEFSCSWKKLEIHIVGLSIDLANPVMQKAVADQQQARLIRARQIAEHLEKQGVSDAFVGTAQIAGNDNIGRPHFAAFLIEAGVCKSTTEAFKKYLSIKNLARHWPEVSTSIEWIRGAGGIAVLAHPLKYKLTRTRLNMLLDDFQAAGGRAMEVISGKQLEWQTRDMASLCIKRGLLASCGSDFHQPDLSWAELADIPPLPGECEPVWKYFA